MLIFKKYLHTLTLLFKEPRQVIDSFLHGEYKSYLHPFKFCLAGVVIVTLINMLSLDFSFEPNMSDLPAGSELLGQMSEWTQIVSVNAATQFLPLSLALLFIVSLSIGAMIFLRGQTNGFFDHIVINTFSVGSAILVLPLMIPVWGLSGIPLTDSTVNSTMPAILIAGVILWIYYLYFRPGGFMQWIRIISAYATGYLIYLLLLGIVSSVTAYFLFAIERISEISG